MPVEKPAALDSLRSTVGLPPIEEYLKTSSESIGQEIVWDKEKTVADFHFPTQRIVILEYQTFNLLAVQMGYGKPMGIECKALRTIYFVS